MLSNPLTRLVVRGVFSGVLALLLYLQASLPGLDGAEILGGIIAGLLSGGGLAGLEVLTPVNKLVGVNKDGSAAS